MALLLGVRGGGGSGGRRRRDGVCAMRRAAGRGRLLAAIHAEAARIGLDDETRYALQERCTGHRSCKDMGVAELGRVLEAVRRAGRGRPALEVVAPPADDVAGMRRRALAIAAGMGLGADYVDAIARRQRDGQPLDALDAEGVRGVIGALWTHQRRRGARASA